MLGYFTEPNRFLVFLLYPFLFLWVDSVALCLKVALWLNAVTFYCIFLLFLIFIQPSLSFPCHCLFSLCWALQALYMAHRWMSEPCKWNKLIISPLQIAENILLISNLGSVCVEESCPRKEGHPPSPVNFGEDLYEKRNVCPALPESRADNSARACSDCLTFDRLDPAGLAIKLIWKNVSLARRVTLL